MSVYSEGWVARLGLIINPVAGLGGAMARKGSDEPDIAARAAAEGRLPHSPERAARALAAFAESCSTEIIAGPVPPASGKVVLIAPDQLRGTAEDTRYCVRAMLRQVDLILFAGGDGTARDICSANDCGVPILGIPSGVKMHSAVFARSPERAGRLAAAFFADERRRIEMVEILDLDEAARRAGQLSARLYSVARTPQGPDGIRQNPKAGSTDTIGELDAAMAEYHRRMRDDTLYVLGPGATMMALKDRLGGGSLLGVDLAEGCKMIACDLNEQELLARVTGRIARIVLSVVGGQGFVLGRGNQQISPAVLKAAGNPPIDVICSAGKLAALRPNELTIDTGDPVLDHRLAGFWPVITGPRRKQIMRVVA